MCKKIAIGVIWCLLFLSVCGFAYGIKEQHGVARARDITISSSNSFVGTIEPLPGVKLPKRPFHKSFACTLAQFHFDGGEQEWIESWFAYGWHCDTFKAHSGSASWWMGDPSIVGYRDMWRERLDTEPVTISSDSVTLSFHHWMRCEAPDWDGGNVKMSVDGGAFQVIFPDAGQYDSIISAFRAHGGSPEWGFSREDPTWRYAQFTEYPGTGAEVVFRFEFVSDEALNTGDVSTWFGWVIDDIVVSSGLQTLVESNCEAPDTTMYPSVVEPRSAFRKSAYDNPPSPDSSWRARDDLANLFTALTSPWIYIPGFACGDTVRKVEVEFRVNEYVPGAAVTGYLQDYYTLEVMWGGFWHEMFHDYDREYEYDCPSENCDCPPNWQLQDRRRIYNGYTHLDGFVGDSIRLRFVWQTDNVIQGTAEWCDLVGAERGMFIDDFIITGSPGSTQDVEEIWEDEATRPIAFGVVADSTYWLKSTVRNSGLQTTANPVWNVFTLVFIDTVPEPDDTVYITLDSCQIAAGISPDTTAQCSILWTPSQTYKGFHQLIIEAHMAGDMYPGNNRLRPLGSPYYIKISLPDSLELGYDTWTAFWGLVTDSAQGYAVRFEPHTFEMFDLHRVDFDAAYGGLCRVHIFDQGADYATPGAELAVTDTFTAQSHDSGWTSVALSTFPALRNMQGERDFWIWIEELGGPGDACGMSCDETTINGEHSYMGSPGGGFDSEGPWDWFIRARICTPDAPRISHTWDLDSTMSDSGLYQVRSHIVDDDSVAGVRLCYLVDHGDWDTVEMQYNPYDTTWGWWAYIQPESTLIAGTSISYYIEAWDPDQNLSRDPPVGYYYDFVISLVPGIDVIKNVESKCQFDYEKRYYNSPKESNSWCGPTSTASCLRWLEVAGLPADQDTLVVGLAKAMDTDCIRTGPPKKGDGTLDSNFVMGIDSYLRNLAPSQRGNYVVKVYDDETFGGYETADEHVKRNPTFDDYKSELDKCEDVLLGMCYLRPNDNEDGGHWVTGMGYASDSSHVSHVMDPACGVKRVNIEWTNNDTRLNYNGNKKVTPDLMVSISPKGADCGDCNGDGNITFADALYLKNYYYQTPPGSPAPLGSGDVNLDGKVNFADALYLKNYYYQTPPGSPPPCEPPKTAPFREKRMEK